MRNEIRKRTVETIYKANENREDYGIDDMIITKALGLATEDCETKEDFFKVLSALNLLNSAIKDRRWKGQLSYGFIKGRAAKLFDQWIANPVVGVSAFYNDKEGAVFFDVDGVVFSYHRIRFSERIRSFIHSASNRPIAWAGIRLQTIPVELFDLALAS